MKKQYKRNSNVQYLCHFCDLQIDHRSHQKRRSCRNRNHRQSRLTNEGYIQVISEKFSSQVCSIN